ncbi:MAG: 50S ribosomal protein L11 methyltransferase [Candidatus Schekmanbacteria bacterium]|nr:MAG: 50S ribosomal protein L11 methyltransferase [Candidatus Schekmanbacteria bacterium]
MKKVEESESPFWWQVSIVIPSYLKDDVSCILAEEMTNGIIEKSYRNSKNRLSLQAFFAQNDFDEKFKNIKNKLNELTSKRNCKGLKITVNKKKLMDKKWGCNWASHFKPVRVGKKLLISPPWTEYSDRKKRINIVIYPGMAFGTGTHESTRLCLKIIEYIVLNQKMKNLDSFLDIGCGSGILSIAAYKLGFKRVKGFDIDKEAIKNAKYNLKLNKLEENIKILCGSPKIVKNECFTFVAVNMVLNELISISSYLPMLVEKKGMLAVSGIIKGQDKEFLKNKFISENFFKEKTFRENEWRGILLSRK